MKKVFLLLIEFFIYATAHSQIRISQDVDILKTTPKEDFRFIVIYRKPNFGFNFGSINLNGPSAKSNEIQYYTELFKTIDELIKWLNTPDYYIFTGEEEPMKKVRLNGDELIAIYDLHKAKKIPYSLIREEKKTEKKVVVEEQKWTDFFYELKVN